MKTLINPENYTDEYIKNLNECFPNWGGQKEYDWVFNRIVGDKKADILILNDENGEAIAGSGISYRKLKMKNFPEFDIGIMTGSWTLPNARGKGCFSEMIEVSKDICIKKGIDFFTAFVMETNPSSRRLKAAGSALIPTFHYFSNETIYDNTAEISYMAGSKDLFADINNKFKNNSSNHLFFSYSDEEFIKQYITRINEVEVLAINNDYAIIEETEKLIKVQMITYDDLDSFEHNIKALSNWATKERSKKLFLYSTRQEVFDVLNKLDFEGLPGFFTVINISNNPDLDERVFENLDINLGDKM